MGVTLIIIGVAIAALVGLVAMFSTARLRKIPRLHWIQFSVGVFLCGAIVAPVAVNAGIATARQEKLSGYAENISGWALTAPEPLVTECTEDGAGCTNTYQCDPYDTSYGTTDQVLTGFDSEGNAQYTSVPRYVPQTSYHTCPYATREYAYGIDTTIGWMRLATNIFGPDSRPFRSNVALPGNVLRGPPAQWLEVRNRSTDDRVPVAAKHTYDNYILASQKAMNRKYAKAVAEYRSRGLLPQPSTAVRNTYETAKVYFVGPVPGNAGDWQSAALQFNAAFGDDLHGDLSLLHVNANIDPDRWFPALMTYWQSPEMGKQAVSKNAVVVAVGRAPDGTVKWARAATGMPRGNEAMLDEIKAKLPGVNLEPQALLGRPRGSMDGDSVAVVHTDGALENIVWGPHRFERVSMTCKGKGAHCIGYTDLIREIEPSIGQEIWISVKVLFISLLVWAVLVLVFQIPARRLLHRCPALRRRVSRRIGSPPDTGWNRRHGSDAW